MHNLPENVPNIWLRSFYGFSPEEDGYIGWSQEAGRDHMLGKIQSGDLIMVYGASTTDTKKSDRLRVLGFLQVDAEPIRDVDKASETGMRRKIENGWRDKWTYGLPVRRAWVAAETVLLERIATETYRPNAGQAIAAWSPSLTREETARALRIKVSETNVFGEPPIAEDALTREPLANAFKPSRAFPGSFGTQVVERVDGPTKLYVFRFKGDAAALLGLPATKLGKRILVKIGVSNDPSRRLEEMNAGFPPAAVGRWGHGNVSEPYPDRVAAEIAEQAFKDQAASRNLDSQGGEFFLGEPLDIEMLFAATPGVSRFGSHA